MLPRPGTKRQPDAPPGLTSVRGHLIVDPRKLPTTTNPRRSRWTACGEGFRNLGDLTFVRTPWRRGWDLNPRRVAPHTISNRADSAALAPLRDVLSLDYYVGEERASGATVGSYATWHREPSQGLTAAALSGTLRVP